MQQTRIKKHALSLLLAFAVVSCATSTEERSVADRDAISREMPLIVEYESKRFNLKRAIGFLAEHGLFEEASGKQVKETMDIEYVYYEASIISLAHGKMGDYRNFVQLAEKELDRARAVIAARFEAFEPKAPSESHIPSIGEAEAPRRPIRRNLF